MVTRTEFSPPTEDIVHTEGNTKCFLGERDCGEGTLYITESILLWKSDSCDESFKLQYKSISLHAISRDTSNFAHECLYCLLESSEAVETEERDPYPGVTEVRFVPLDKNNIKPMYDALTICQELHPDDDDENNESDDEMNENNDEEFTDHQFYTAADDMTNIELSEEGQATLLRLQQNMQIASPEEFGDMVENGIPNGHSGQFDDVDDEIH